MITFSVFLIGVAMQAPPAPHYRLLSECDPSAQVRAEIAKHTTMEIHFSIAGSPTCYSVTLMVDGKQVRGYVVDRDLDAVQTFDKARVAVEREAFRAPPLWVRAAPPAAVTAPADSGKEESKTSKDAVKKDPVEKNPLKQTPKIEF